MEIDPVASEKPDIRILMTHAEAQGLQSMLYEARAYAQDCQESTVPHDSFIRALEKSLNT